MYLGASCSESLDNTKEIKRRIAIAKSKFIDLHKTFKTNSLRTNTKIRLLNALIFPIATYGCEAWTIKKHDEHLIATFEMWCYRRILNVTWMEKRTNDSILTEINPKERLLVFIRRRKLNYFGHVARGSAGELSKTILEGKVQGKRPRGRPRTTWFDNIKKWTNMRIYIAVQLAQQRNIWKEMVRLAAAHPEEDGTDELS